MSMQIGDRTLFSRGHTWLRLEGELALVGISEWVQSQIGEVEKVHIVDAGDTVEQYASLGRVRGEFGGVEILAPVSGEIVEVNGEALASPDLLNDSPFETWLVKLAPASAEEMHDLLDEDAYAELTSEL